MQQSGGENTHTQREYDQNVPRWRFHATWKVNEVGQAVIQRETMKQQQQQQLIAPCFENNWDGRGTRGQSLQVMDYLLDLLPVCGVIMIAWCFVFPHYRTTLMQSPSTSFFFREKNTTTTTKKSAFVQKMRHNTQCKYFPKFKMEADCHHQTVELVYSQSDSQM